MSISSKLQKRTHLKEEEIRQSIYCRIYDGYIWRIETHESEKKGEEGRRYKGKVEELKTGTKYNHNYNHNHSNKHLLGLNDYVLVHILWVFNYSCTPQNNSMKLAILSTVCRYANWGTENVSNLVKVTDICKKQMPYALNVESAFLSKMIQNLTAWLTLNMFLWGGVMERSLFGCMCGALNNSPNLKYLPLQAINDKWNILKDVFHCNNYCITYCFNGNTV